MTVASSSALDGAVTDPWDSFPAAGGAQAAPDPWAAFPTPQAAPDVPPVSVSRAGSDDSIAQTFTLGPNGELVPKTGAESGGKAGMPTAFPGFQMGIADPIVAAGQLVAHAVKSVAPSFTAAIDDAARAREAAYRDDYRPGALDTGRTIGSAVATAPLAFAMPGSAAAGILPRVASGAASGALSGALQPVDATSEGDFWGQKGEQAVAGAATGGGTTAALGGLARVISPQTPDNVRLLMDRGVRPTPGQILGAPFNRLEEIGQDVPLVGSAIRGARDRASDQFTRSAINDALAPIGQSLDASTPLGRDAIAEMHGKIGAAYDALVPRLSVSVDPTFRTDVSRLVGNAAFMPADQAAQFRKVLNDQVVSKFSPNGTMTGETFKEVESELGRLQRQYGNSPIGAERQFGGAVQELQAQLRGLLTRSNPDLADELAAHNLAYANSLRIQGAAGGTGAAEGVFSPAQLLQSVRQLDPSLRKGVFARGGALMQDLADAGKSVLGNKVANSGTPERGAALALGGLYGLSQYSPASAIGAATAGAGTMAAYSPWGQSLMAHLLTTRPNLAVPAARGVRAGAPAGAAGAAGLISRLLTQ